MDSCLSPRSPALFSILPDSDASDDPESPAASQRPTASPQQPSTLQAADHQHHTSSHAAAKHHVDDKENHGPNGAPSTATHGPHATLPPGSGAAAPNPKNADPAGGSQLLPGKAQRRALADVTDILNRKAAAPAQPPAQRASRQAAGNTRTQKMLIYANCCCKPCRGCVFVRAHLLLL